MGARGRARRSEGAEREVDGDLHSSVRRHFANASRDMSSRSWLMVLDVWCENGEGYVGAGSGSGSPLESRTMCKMLSIIRALISRPASQTKHIQNTYKAPTTLDPFLLYHQNEHSRPYLYLSHVQTNNVQARSVG